MNSKIDTLRAESPIRLRRLKRANQKIRVECEQLKQVQLWHQEVAQQNAPTDNEDLSASEDEIILDLANLEDAKISAFNQMETVCEQRIGRMAAFKDGLETECKEAQDNIKQIEYRILETKVLIRQWQDASKILGFGYTEDSGIS